MRIQPWVCLHLLRDVAHGTVNMCAHMVNVSVKFAQFSRIYAFALLP